MTTHELTIQLLKAVQYQRATDLPCKRINTFAFLKKADDLNSEGLGMTIRDKGIHFFSRKWGEQGHDPNSLKWDFPLLAVVYIAPEIKAPIRKNSDCPTNIHEFDLLLIDKIENQKASNTTPCQRRTENQIRQDCISLLHSAFQYLSEVIWAETSGSTDYPDGYYHPGELDQLRTDGLITAWLKDGKKSTKYKRSLQEVNEQSRGIPYVDKTTAGIRMPFFLMEESIGLVNFDFSNNYNKQLNSFGNSDVLK